MRVVSREIELTSKGFTDILDLTPRLDQLVRREGFREGHLLVFVPGSTGGLTTIEYEPGLVEDLKRFFEQWIPMDRDYAHNFAWQDGNGYAHLRAAMLKPDLMIPIVNGRMALGTWQQVVFIDFDNRKRHRRLVVQFQGL
ncbi:MAG: YjbQ family protein [Calditrichaeota bacterium]|nr:MAG: YjbQ family protein [Calditrichota bacterium]